jgi:N-acetylglucosaminyl-diphospho-decaprenol L-rhamnosyltransferase
VPRSDSLTTRALLVGRYSLNNAVLLFASYSGALGGAERLLIDWAAGLDDEVWLACPEGRLAVAARAAGVRVFVLSDRRLELRGSIRDRLLAAWRLDRHGREVRRLAGRLEPEVLVLWGMRSALGYLVARGPDRWPTVFHHNDFLPGPLIAWLVRVAAARADLVTVPSRAVARDLDPQGRLGDLVGVVHPGVDAARFDPAARPLDPPRVLVLGAIVGWKRPDLALETFALARRRCPDLRLRLVGAPIGSEGERLGVLLRARAAEEDLSGAVEFVGFVSDPAGELADATCLLHCAEREPFGLAVLEAMAAGRPVVVPAAAGPAEIVDGECGFLFPPGDVDAAADAVTRLASEPELAARMGAEGRGRAIARFDLSESRRRWAQAISRVRPTRAASKGAHPLEVVTVTHNSGSFLGALLASVQRHLPGVQVVVVDCASTDDTVTIAGRSSIARIIELDHNLGFGRACNRGMEQVTAPVTALLNPDVELLDDSLLRACTEVLAGGSDERLLAPLVLGSDGRPQDSVHPLPGSPAELARTLVPYTRLPGRVAGRLAAWRDSAPQRVGWAVGCALVAPTETLRRLGPFDERIFLYGEDLDLGLRAAQAGIETWFWPASRVLHHGAHATATTFDGEAFTLLARGRRDVVRQHGGRRAVTVDDAAQGLTFVSRIAARRVLGREASRERQQLEALLAVRREGR